MSIDTGLLALDLDRLDRLADLVEQSVISAARQVDLTRVLAGAAVEMRQAIAAVRQHLAAADPVVGLSHEGYEALTVEAAGDPAPTRPWMQGLDESDMRP